MDTKPDPRVVVWFIAAAFFVLFIILGALILVSFFLLGSIRELTIGMSIVFGVGSLFVLLFIIAAGFSALGLTDPRQALGLPEGTIRALIALLLILVWVILSVFMFGFLTGVNTETPSTRLAQQLFTTMSTLVVAISAFYFGTSTVSSARRAQAQLPRPVIGKIDPSTGEQGAIALPLTIQGKNFRSPQVVRFVRDSKTMVVTEVLSNATEIHCTLTIDTAQTVGKWDLIVVNEVGSEGHLAEAFEVTTSSAPEHS